MERESRAQQQQRNQMGGDNETICVKLKTPRFKGTDYHLSFDGQGHSGTKPNRYLPGSIEDYEPGHSSISEHEKQLVSMS